MNSPYDIIIERHLLHAAAREGAVADQVAAELRDSRCCDALDPCDSCKSGRVEVATRRHVARSALAR